MAEKSFTKDQLAQFDGKDGHQAYVAIDNLVYDVSNVDLWKDGRHRGQLAGKDLTSALKRSPHKDKVLGDLPEVGKYVG